MIIKFKMSVLQLKIKRDYQKCVYDAASIDLDYMLIKNCVLHAHYILIPISILFTIVTISSAPLVDEKRKHKVAQCSQVDAIYFRGRFCYTLRSPGNHLRGIFTRKNQRRKSKSGTSSGHLIVPELIFGMGVPKRLELELEFT